MCMCVVCLLLDLDCIGRSERRVGKCPALFHSYQSSWYRVMIKTLKKLLVEKTTTISSDRVQS